MATGTVTTYNLTTGVKLNVENIIWTLTPTDVPLQGTQGADGRTALSSDTCFEKKIEWLDEVLLVPSSNLGATCNTADTYITVSSTAANAGVLNFQTGDVLVVDAPAQLAGVTGVQETMYVTGYGTTSNTLTVTRAFAGSTAVIHSNNVTVKGVGQANPEGSDAGSARAVDRVDRSNYTQIFGPTTVQVSGTENAIQKYGLTGTEFDKQVGNRIKEAFVSYEQAVLYGIAYENSGAGQRTMGGISSYIVTNVDGTTTVLTETALLAQLKACFDNGGCPDRMVMGSRQKQVVSSIASSNIRYAQDTNIRGQKIDYYDSDFGRQMAVLDRWCRSSDLFLFERDQATMATLRPLTFEMLAKTGDSAKGQVVGEKSLWFRRQSWSAQFNALT
jgi:hypothetical protein